MSVGTRIVFARFATIHSTKLIPWQEHTRRVAGVEPVVDGPETGPAIVWKLASANNRTLARSASIFATFDAARSEADRLVREVAGLEARFASNELTGSYGWVLLDRGEPAVICSRWYSTSRDRTQALDLARTALGSAVLESGAHQIDAPQRIAARRGPVSRSRD
jgi:hypothetical protein